MKSKLAILIGTAVLGLSSNSFASYKGAFLSLHRGPGFTPAEYSNSVSCEIFHDRVLVTRRNHGFGLESVEVRKLSQKMNPLYQAIQKADSGEIEKTIGPVDGPTAIYSAYKTLPNDAVKRVLLESTGTGENLENRAPEARALKMFIDLHCGQ